MIKINLVLTTDPCGTPDSTISVADHRLFSTIYCCLLERKECYQFIDERSDLYQGSLLIQEIECLLKVKAYRINDVTFMNAFYHLSTKFNNAVLQECLWQKPDCALYSTSDLLRNPNKCFVIFLSVNLEMTGRMEIDLKFNWSCLAPFL